MDCKLTALEIGFLTYQKNSSENAAEIHKRINMRYAKFNQSLESTRYTDALKV